MIPLQGTTSDNCWVLWLLHASKHLNHQVPQRVEHLTLAQAPLRLGQVAYAVDVNQSGRCNSEFTTRMQKSFGELQLELD
jgi:hypothetical protein